MSDAAPMLTARGVARRFGSQIALGPTDVSIFDGEVVALVGANGAGKSTLLSILAGALPPSVGCVELRAGVRSGWMPQGPAHYGRLSARENIELFARLAGDPAPHRSADRLLQELELPAGGQLSATLSLGNRQRLNLALAMLGEPNLLLLDEPTASLDPRQRRRLLEYTSRLRDRGGSVVLSTQHVEDLEGLADRVLGLVDGSLAFRGTFAEYRAADAEQDLV